MKIGIFDSGIGGRNVLSVLQQALPGHSFIYACDSLNVPYGTKSPEQIIELTRHAIQPLLQSCQIIVIACNTVTSYAIRTLRRENPNVQFIGLEPAIKLATQLTKTNTVAVCATPATLRSPNYLRLKNLYTKHLKQVIEPECTDWARLIEYGQANRVKLNQLSARLLNQNCDVVVLGCTHYHELKPRFLKHMPNATILEPSDAVLKRVKRYL
ncbi:MAG: aspartate/glutamate racemase family protein [Candidatus Nomurabacteria bacterium]|jgi:glutamate racemase|nr:aspartate/glutamate racemase family protein [Candidatus Nomurabacteria bacterium]